MRKQTFLPGAVAAITFLVLGAIALGIGGMHVASAHIQTPAVQTQLTAAQVQANGVGKDSTDPGETLESSEDQGQDQNLPGGGHQDQGQADHQFEGTE